MDILEKLPHSDVPEVRRRIEELFSRQMLGAVLIGKFVGDYAAILTTNAFGIHIGYSLGIVLTISLFIYWEKVQRRAQKEASKLSGAQKQIDDYN